MGENMDRIDAAIQVLRIVTENYDRLYTYEEVTAGLEKLQFGYTTTEDEGGIHLSLDMDENLTIHFTYENNQYKIPRFNIIHSILNELNTYFNELEVDDYVSDTDMKICYKDIGLLEAVGIISWEDKMIAVDKVLSQFHEDKLVATLMFLKYIGGTANQKISYMERHSTPITYRNITTSKYVELYNLNYESMITIDIQNCNMIEDEYDVIVKGFKNWKQKTA